jgi:hypothetical protein
MKSTLLLAALLIFASSNHAQVREGMAAPAQQPAFNSPDADDDPPENPYLNSWGDDDCCTVAPIEVEPSSDASSQPAEEPAVVEGTNDGEYVPSTLMPYQKALHEGMQELAAMRGIAAAQSAQAQGSFKTSGSSKSVQTTSTLPAQNAKNGSKLVQPIVVKQETVAEAARENREKQVSGEKPKMIVTQDASGGIVVTEEPQKSAQDSK